MEHRNQDNNKWKGFVFMTTDPIKPSNETSTPISTGQSSPPPGRAAGLATLSKTELRKLLADIEKSPEPEMKMGACCYSPAPPTTKWNYICPICAKKTLYNDYDVASKWDRELASCRRLFRKLPHRDVMTLNEIDFCRKCHPNAKEPKLTLTIRFDDNTSVTLEEIDSSNLRILQSLLSGKLEYPTSNEGSYPLLEEVPRLRKMLGLEDE